MNLLYGLLASGLVGSIIFVVLLVIRPVTMKLFSKTWHYYSFFVPILFLLGGTVVAAGVIGRVQSIDFIVINEGVDVDTSEGYVAPQQPLPLPQITQPYAQTSTGYVMPQPLIPLPQMPGPNVQTPASQQQELFAPSVNTWQVSEQVTLAAWGFSDGLMNLARVGYRYLLVIWGLGFLIFLSFCIGRYVNFRRLVLKDSEKYTDVYCSVPVVISSFAQTPMLLGVFRPIIVLPRIAYTKEELGIVLTHEMVHYKRKDLAYKMLAFFAQAIHWYNPLGILLVRQLSDFCEMSVDEKMAAEMDNMGRKFYGETILQVLIKSTAKRSSVLLPATNLCCSKNELKRRLSNMKNAKKMKKTALALAVLVTAAIIGGGLFASYLFDAAVPESSDLSYYRLDAATGEMLDMNTTDTPFYGDGQAEEHDQNMIITPAEAEDWWAALRYNFDSAVKWLRAEYSHDLNISALVIDTQYNRIVMACGDIDNRAQAYHIFWPITTAIFVDALGISVHDEFPNELYYLPGDLIWRSARAWHLLFDDINYHEGYSTLMQGFRHGDPNVFFNAAAMLDRNLLFELFGELGLGYVAQNDDISSIFGRFELSPVEVGLLYSMLVNGGTLYPALGPDVRLMDGGRQVFSENGVSQAMEVLHSHLVEMDEFWGIFGQIRDREYFDEFKGSVIGQTNDFMTLNGPNGDVAGSWFVGLYPAEAPRFVTVISLLYDLDYQNQRWNQGITRSSMTDLAAIMYEMFLAFRTQYPSDSEPISVNETRVTAEDFGLTVDFDWIINPQHIVCDERNISFFMQPIYLLHLHRRTEFSYLDIDVNDVETFPVYARITFTEAAKIAASEIYERYGISVNGLVGYMHLVISNDPNFGKAWVGWIIDEKRTKHSDGFELFYFTIDLVTGEVIELHMNTPETPFLG